MSVSVHMPTATALLAFTAKGTIRAERAVITIGVLAIAETVS